MANMTAEAATPVEVVAPEKHDQSEREDAQKSHVIEQQV